MGNKFKSFLLVGILLLSSVHSVEAKSFDFKHILVDSVLGALQVREEENRAVEVWTECMDYPLEDIIDTVKQYADGNELENPYAGEVLNSDNFCFQYQFINFDINAFNYSNNGTVTVARSGKQIFADKHTWNVDERTGNVSNEKKVRGFNNFKPRDRQELRHLNRIKNTYDDTMTFLAAPLEKTVLYWANGRKIQKSGFAQSGAKFLGSSDIECKGIKLYVESYKWRVNLGLFSPMSYWDYYFYNDRLVLVHRIDKSGEQKVASHWYFILGYTNNFSMDDFEF